MDRGVWWTIIDGSQELDTTEQLKHTDTSFVITFRPGSRHLLISWLWSPSAMILEPRKVKSATVSIYFPPSISHEVMRPIAMILVF